MRTEREMLSCEISDAYKEVFGVRPRHIDFTNTSIEDLRKILSRLYDDIEGECFWAEEVAIADEQEIAAICAEQNIDRETYDRWLKTSDTQTEEF